MARACASIASASAGVGTKNLSRRRTIENACAASNAAAPGYAVVSTWVSAAGSLRHSSYRYDWIPPTLGGKSFVTSSDVMLT